MLSVGVSATDIAALDAWTAPDGGLPAAFTVGAGTDRMLLVAIAYEISGVSDVASCELGATASGASLTFVARVLYKGSSGTVYNYAEIWRLMDTDMPSADSTLSFSYTSDTPGVIGVGWGSYENVHQTTPVSDSDTGFNEAQTISLSLTGVAGGASIFVSNHKNSDQDAVWGDPSEAFDVTPGNDFTFTGADSVHTGSGTITGDVTYSSSAGRIVIVGVEFAPTSGAAAATPTGRRRKILTGRY